MNKTQLKQFKKELRDLLIKHNVIIGLRADDGSDWWGITGEHIAVYDSITKEHHELNWGSCWLSPSDLKD